MNLNVLLIVGAVVALQCSCAAPRNGIVPSEALVVVPIHGDGMIVHVSDERPIPDDVRDDLERFEAALAGLGIRMRDLRISFSPDGKAAFAYEHVYEGHNDAWLWPSWRDADDVMAYPGAGSTRFVGPSHVSLLVDGQGTIVEFAKSRKWSLPVDVDRRAPRRMAVDDAGEWWALALEDGELYVGTFPEDHDRLTPDRSIDLVGTPRDRGVEFVGGRRFVVVAMEERHRLVAVDPSDGTHITLSDRPRRHVQLSPRRAGDGSIVVDNLVFQFGESVSEYEVNRLWLRRREVLGPVSPSGRFVFTAREPPLFPLAPVVTRVRHLPGVDRRHLLPADPNVHPWYIRGWITW